MADNNSGGSLTEMAKALQARQQQFQQALASTASMTASEPASALTAVDRCWAEAASLEQSELGFLAQMGPFGTQQLSQAKASWADTRLQILLCRGQCLLRLGRLEDAQSTVDQARASITDPAHPASALLDDLEASIIQAGV
jgi:hypothetical protein